eukprot:6830535-Prymnesium_polylepis.1
MDGGTGNDTVLQSIADLAKLCTEHDRTTTWRFSSAAVLDATEVASLQSEVLDAEGDKSLTRAESASGYGDRGKKASGTWLSGAAATVQVDSPVWELLVSHVASLANAPAIILDLASGPGEPACSLSARFPRAKVTASDNTQPMLSAARARIASLGLAKRVKVRLLCMTDLSSISSGSVDLVTVCLGLHLISFEELPAVLVGIARGK